MKRRNLPTKTGVIPIKAAYKIRHFIRVYPDRSHPEDFNDLLISSRYDRKKVITETMADAWQFYNRLEVCFQSEELDSFLSEPRDFSKLHLDKNYETDDD